MSDAVFTSAKTQAYQMMWEIILADIASYERGVHLYVTYLYLIEHRESFSKSGFILQSLKCNMHLYAGVLMTFPGCDPQRPVTVYFTLGQITADLPEQVYIAGSAPMLFCQVRCCSKVADLYQGARTGLTSVRG